MRTYKVEIEETLVKVVDIEAECEGDAIKQVENKYRNSEIVLYADDFIDYKIRTI